MKKIFLLMLLLFPVSVAAQTAAFNGFCDLGSTPAMTSGLPSSNLNQGLIPQCQVSVYLTGTVNLAAIYADATNTPLTNPFTASTKAQWLFFAATGQGYDVVMNGGFPPLVYTVPVTLTDLSVPTGGGSAGCTTSGIAGTLVASNGTGGCQPAQVEVNSAPLATPSPINFTNTPSITVANPGTGVIQLTGAALKTDGSANSLQNLLNFIDTSTIQFTNPSGGIESATCVTSTVSVIGCMKPDGTTISIASGIITAITATSSTLGIVKPDNTTVTISGGVLSAAPQSALTIQAEDVTLGGKFAAGSGQTLDFNSTLPAPPGGNTSVTFQNDPSTGRVSAYVPTPSAVPIRAQIIPPDTNQGIFIPFTACNITTVPNPTDLVAPGSYCNATSGSMGGLAGSIFDHNLTMTYQWVNPVLPAGITSANFVKAYAITQTGAAASSPGPTSFSCAGSGIAVGSPAFTQVASLLTSVNATNFGSTSCTWSQTQSVLGTFLDGTQQLMGTWVEYSGPPIAQPDYLNIGPYLWLNTNTNTLETQPYWPNGIFPLLVSQLPAAGPSQDAGGGYPYFFVSDLQDIKPGDLCVGTGTEGSAYGWCQANSGGGYTVYAPSGLTATGLSGGFLGSVPYQTGPNATAFVPSPTTIGQTYFLGWQPVATPQIVQKVYCGGTNCSLPSPVTSGDTLFVITTDHATSGTGCGVSDTLATTYTLEQTGHAGTNVTLTYVGIAGSSGSNTFTITGSDVNFCTVSAIEVSGVDGSTPVDVAGATSNSGGATVGATITTVTANDLLLEWEGDTITATTMSISPAATFVTGGGLGSTLNRSNVWSLSAPTATTYNTTFTAGSSNVNFTGGILALKPAGAGAIAPTAIPASSVVAGVSSIIPGTNVTCTPNVSGSCSGAVTVNAAGGGSVSITSSTGDLTVSPSPLTGTGTIDLNLGHANTWTAAQTFNLGLTIASGHALTNTGVSDGCGTWASGVLGSTGSPCGSGGGSGTVTDSSGTTTANQLALSTTTTHQIQYSTAIPNGTTATTQTTGDNTTKVATDAFVLANAGGGSGTVTDGAGTSTPNLTAQSTSTPHVIQYVSVPPGAAYSSTLVDVFGGDSLGVVATPNQDTATSVTCNGTTCSFTAATPSFYTVGQWINLLGNVTGAPNGGGTFAFPLWSPSCMNFAIVKVTAKSGSTITFNEAQTIVPGHIGCTGTQSGTGGYVQDASYFYPQQVTQQPYLTQGGTATPAVYNRAWPGQGLPDLDTNFATYFGDLAPTSTGNPANFFFFSDDICLSGSTPGTVSAFTGHLQSIMSQAHTDGFNVILMTIPEGPDFSCGIGGNGNGNPTFWGVNAWTRASGQCGATQAKTNCADQVVDIQNYAVNDRGNGLLVQQTGGWIGHLYNQGGTAIANAANIAMIAKDAFNSGGLAGYGANNFYGVQNFGQNSTGSNIVYDFSMSGGNTWQTVSGQDSINNLLIYRAAYNYLQFLQRSSLCWSENDTNTSGDYSEPPGGGCFSEAYQGSPNAIYSHKLAVGTGVYPSNTTPPTPGDASGGLVFQDWLIHGRTSDQTCSNLLSTDAAIWYNSSGTPQIKACINGSVVSLGGSSSVAWGSITGTLSAQTDLQTALNAKQATLTGTGLARNTGASSELSGDVSTSGSNVTTLANTAVTPGSYTNINATIDSKGRITSASNGTSGGANPGASVFNITNATTNTGTSATSLLGGAQTIPSGYLLTSTPININMGGIFSVPTAYTGTVTVAVFVDGSQIATTGALTIPSTAVTNGSWTAQCQLTTYTTGTSGTYSFGCPFMLLPSSTATITLNGGSLAVSGTNAIDTTISHTFDLKWTWSTATGSPTVTGQWGTALVGGAPVVSVSNSDGTIAVSPTTGAAVASIALGHANTWTGQQTFVAPVLGAATATSLLASGTVDGTAPITVTTGSSATLGGTYKSGYTFNQNATAATAITYTLPTAAAGLQYCVGNSWNGSAATTGTLELLTSASGQFIIFTDGTLSATGGYVISAGAAADFACVVGVDSTHWFFKPSSGTWSKH